MNTIRKGMIQRNTGLRTLHACLLALGAERKKVYSRGYRTPGNPELKIGTLYNRYTYDELHRWLDDLLRESLIWHPDLHPEDRNFYDKKMRHINAAYQQGKNLLKRRGH